MTNSTMCAEKKLDGNKVKRYLMACTNRKCSDKPAHPYSLISNPLLHILKCLNIGTPKNH